MRIALIALCFTAISATAQSGLTGFWQGTATIQEESVGIEFRIFEDQGELK